MWLTTVDIMGITTKGVPINPRNPEVSRMVVNVLSDGVGGGDYDGRSRDHCRHWAACEGELSWPELLCSRMLGMTLKLDFPRSSPSAQWSSTPTIS